MVPYSDTFVLPSSNALFRGELWGLEALGDERMAHRRAVGSRELDCRAVRVPGVVARGEHRGELLRGLVPEGHVALHDLDNRRRLIKRT